MTEVQNISKKNNTVIRRVLMLGSVVIVVVVSAWFYVNSGRFIGTDNAYVRSAKILVTPQVGGMIVSVAIDENQPVKKGDILFIIDPASYEIAVDEAKAELEEAYTEIQQLKAQFRQKMEDRARAQIEVDYADRDLERKNPLASKGAVSKSNLDEAARKRDAAQKTMAVLKEESNGILAALAGKVDINPEDHPLYQKKLAALHEAELNLSRTKVVAPADGIVGSAPHVGDYVNASVPLFNLVGTNNVWIEANYKETELTNVKIGQPVSIKIDTYPDQEWQGHVESISPATGSEFSILPAQNATGNWVKVVQRIAVRIAFDKKAEELPLRTGMSTHVTIDTGKYPHAIIQDS